MSNTFRQLRCQGCGAALPVSAGIRFLTCNYCHAQLEVVEDAATSHTRLLESIDLRTQKIEREVETLRLEGELKRLDDAWQRYDEKLNPRDSKGRRSEPLAGLFGLSAIGMLVGGALMISEARWLGLVIILVAVWFFIRTLKVEINRSRIVEGTRLKYERRRKDLLDRLNSGR